ncbi:hypothetical protein AMC99_00265 [Altererythrobacter epoxidivorans]|uniref:Uncharacterized protein n=1 Tax=Altererythrobacter epoxidivorans TaxID=361183 RepID=A0A0M5L267_9SPHN|nr:hypothetical protein AMC99_00265 [Altererythrobacter epoxidivorans]
MRAVWPEAIARFYPVKSYWMEHMEHSPGSEKLRREAPAKRRAGKDE